DIRKDALYCDAADSLRRRAARTVLDALFARLTTWMAPMLVFTMEDVWLNRYPDTQGSVHLEDFPATPKGWRDDALAAKWERLRTVRRVVTGAIEVERQAKVVGSSLEAAPVVYIEDGQTRSDIEATDFADICITSSVVISAEPAPDSAFTLPDVPGVAVVFGKAQGQKCLRCWKVLPDVGLYTHPGVCGRCDAALG
ncbi:MAG: class I tRNA ligase family protein, partial [Pseudomonadota bacterium]